MDEITFKNFTLPVVALALYGLGYIARMTRASMAEVMTSQYIRTAILKGLPYKKVIMRHALRNALIAPFTVIMLQIPWLLSGVVIVEIMFNYKGFGFALNKAAMNMDSKEQVDAFYAKAIELGATDEGPPGQRIEGFYAGYFRDLDGNKLNAFVFG